MNAGGRARARSTFLRRAGLVAAVFVVLALLLLISGHWILGIVAALIAIVGVWVYLQARAVR
jgi:hypothetical protein